MSELLNQKSRDLPKGSPALGNSEIERLLGEVPGWSRDGVQKIARTFEFKNFHETIEFVNALAWVIHREDHHPDMSVSYNRCHVVFSTHSVGGLSKNDFICAAKINALL